MKESKTSFTIAEMANMSDAEILGIVNEYRDSRKLAEARINLLNALNKYAESLGLDISEQAANAFIESLSSYEKMVNSVKKLDITDPLASLAQLIESL